WFFANYSYQIAIADTEVGIVNVLSSTSSLFTLICAAIYPGSAVDRFSLSKLVAFEPEVPNAALWALSSAVLYAVYLVALRRKVDHEDKLDIPLFFGFVGLFCLLCLWPVFLLLNYVDHLESFQWPNTEQCLFILINGLIGTVSYTWMFYVGAVPVFVAFLAISALTHWESWDPALVLVKKCVHCICSRRLVPMT
ncbi:S35F5-like protein, partial [Mya arenaria]